MSRSTRRHRRTAASLAIAGLMLLGTSAVAHADGAIPNCTHGTLNTTALSIALPQNDPRTAGGARTDWLYKAVAGAWRYTGLSVHAASYAGGVWYSGGHMVNQLAFYLRPGSGHYIVKEAIWSPRGGAPVVYWAPYYQNHMGNYFTRYCSA